MERRRYKVSKIGFDFMLKKKKETCENTKIYLLATLIMIGMCAMLFSKGIAAFAETSGDYTYSVNADQVTCTITKYNGAGGKVEIPSTIDTYRVTVIGNKAFKDVTNMTDLTIPNGVTTIGEYAFLGNSNLNNVTFPNSLMTIGAQAFSNCTKLENVVIPDSVTSLGFYGFSSCINLKHIKLSNNLTTIPDGLFCWCVKLEEVTFPNGLTTIKGWAFERCNSITSFTIPSSVTTIGNFSFVNCKELTSIYVDGTPNIGVSAFSNSPVSLYSSSTESISGYPCIKVMPHSIAVNATSHGTIVLSAISGMKDEVIGIKMVPDEGYTWKSGALQYNDGDGDVTISGNSFVMPDKDITISSSGEFVAIQPPAVTTPLGTTYNFKPTWSWTNPTGEGYFRYKLNDELWKYTTDTNFTPNTELTNGTHILYVQAINDNSDWSSSGSASVVVLPTITNITVTPLTATVQKGNTQMFSAVVVGTNAPTQTVTWNVSGSAIGTQISSGGALSVALNETASTLTITATSTLDTSKVGTATVMVTEVPTPPVPPTPPTPVYTLDISAGTGGSIMTGKNGNYPKGAIINLVAVPLVNYSFGSWSSVGCGSFENINSASTTFTMSTSGASITANFIYTGSTTEKETNKEPVDESITQSNKESAKASSGKESGYVMNLIQEPSHKAIVTISTGTLGEKITATIGIDIDKKTGKATLNLSDLPTGFITNGGDVAITAPNIEGITDYTLGIPVAFLTVPTGSFSFKSDIGHISLPSNILSGISGPKDKNVQITIGKGDKSKLSSAVRDAIGERPLVKLEMAVDGKKLDWKNDKTPVIVTINYKPTESELKTPENIIAWEIDEKSNIVPVKNSRYNAAVGQLTFKTTHFSDYGAGLNNVNFLDVSPSAWYFQAVNYMAARGITTGSGNSKYNPEGKLTCGEFSAMVMKAYGISPYKGEVAPDKYISRQEMFTLLYNILKTTNKLPEASNSKLLSNFSDSGEIAVWAEDAINFMVKSDVMCGNKGKLNPKKTTTRAEMAQVLYLLVVK